MAHQPPTKAAEAADVRTATAAADPGRAGSGGEREEEEDDGEERRGSYLHWRRESRAPGDGGG